MSLSAAKERLLLELKTRGPADASALALRLRVTPTAVRQHLTELEEASLVTFRELRGRVGRPVREWRITRSADDRFPDSHADLTVALIESARKIFGPEGLERLLDERAQQQAEEYRSRMPDGADVERRLQALVQIREDEGYMAELTEDTGDGYVLVENHCPVCEAATVCQSLCRTELDVFRQSLGTDVLVERTEYLLDGDRRCAYRVVDRVAF